MGEVRFKLGPAVKDGQLRFVSVSQIESFDPGRYGGCERRWWFRRVARAAEPQGTAASLGEKVHQQIERYLATGDADVLGPVARAGKHLLPAPGRDLLLEHTFGVVHEEGGEVNSPILLAGVPLVGAVDCMVNRGEHLDVEGDLQPSPGVAEVLDWKTTSRVHDQLDSWGHVLRKGLAKTGEELARTWQMMAYARLATLMFGPGPKRVSHVYFQTSWPNLAAKRTYVLGADEAAGGIFRSEHLVERMKGVARVKDVKDVAPNYAACGAWGGCPHKDRCPRDVRGALAAVFGAGTRSASVETTKGEDWKMSLLEKRRAAKAAADKATTPADAEVAKLEAEDAVVRAGGVAPPDVPAPLDVAQVPESFPTNEPISVGEECGNGGTTVKTATEEKSYSCPCGATLRVRPKKLADGAYYALVPKHKVGAQAKKKPPVLTKTVLTAVPDEEEPVAAATIPGLILYLGCSPRRARAQRLEDLAAKLAREIATAAGEGDIRSSDKPALGFGKWKGVLAEAALADRPSGHWAVSPTDEFGMIVFNALAPGADEVVG